jgi:hypothetical protein
MPLIRIGFLYVIDHKGLDRSFRRNKFQPELLLDCSEDRESRFLHTFPRGVFRSGGSRMRILRRPAQRDVVLPSEPGLFYNSAAGQLREDLH